MTSIFVKYGPRALIGAGLMFVGVNAVPLLATSGGSYSATMAAPLAAPKQDIIGGVMWKCAGQRCIAPAEGGRPVMVCTRVARKFGAITRFALPQGELSAEDLAKCNAPV